MSLHPPSQPSSSGIGDSFISILVHNLIGHDWFPSPDTLRADLAHVIGRPTDFALDNGLITSSSFPPMPVSPMRTIPTSMRIDGGARAATGMGDWYESIPWTLIRDGRLRSRVDREKRSAGACPQPGEGGQTTPEPFDQPMHPIFIPCCAGTSRHERLPRKHVLYTDTEWMASVTSAGPAKPAARGLVPRLVPAPPVRLRHSPCTRESRVGPVRYYGNSIDFAIYGFSALGPL